MDRLQFLDGGWKSLNDVEVSATEPVAPKPRLWVRPQPNLITGSQQWFLNTNQSNNIPSLGSPTQVQWPNGATVNRVAVPQVNAPGGWYANYYFWTINLAAHPGGRVNFEAPFKIDWTPWTYGGDLAVSVSFYILCSVGYWAARILEAVDGLTPGVITPLTPTHGNTMATMDQIWNGQAYGMMTLWMASDGTKIRPFTLEWGDFRLTGEGTTIKSWNGSAYQDLR